MLAERPRAVALREHHRVASDLELCGSCGTGSRAAFSELVQRHRAPLLAYCGRLVGADHAEDVLQQGLLKAWMALDEGRADVANPRAWLYRIAHNQAMDHLRRAGVQWDELDCEWESPESTERTFEALERLGRVTAGIRELPVRQREALVMHSIEGESYAEVATNMDTNVPAVSQLIVRARARLREIPAFLPPTLVARRLFRATRRAVAGLGGGTKVAMVAATLATGAGVPLATSNVGPGPQAQARSSLAGSASAAPGSRAARIARRHAAGAHGARGSRGSRAVGPGRSAAATRYFVDNGTGASGDNTSGAARPGDATATRPDAASGMSGSHLGTTVGGRAAPHVPTGPEGAQLVAGVPAAVPHVSVPGGSRTSSTPVHLPAASVPAAVPSPPVPLPGGAAH